MTLRESVLLLLAATLTASPLFAGSVGPADGTELEITVAEKARAEEYGLLKKEAAGHTMGAREILFPLVFSGPQVAQTGEDLDSLSTARLAQFIPDVSLEQLRAQAAGAAAVSLGAVSAHNRAPGSVTRLGVLIGPFLFFLFLLGIAAASISRREASDERS